AGRGMRCAPRSSHSGSCRRRAPRRKRIYSEDAVSGTLRQHHDDRFVSVEVTQVGFADEDGAEGLIWMKSGDMRVFAMRSFSGEVALHMKRFLDGDRSSIPSIFNI